MNNNYRVLLVGVTDYSPIGAVDLEGKNDVLIMRKAMNEGLKIPLTNISVLGVSSGIVTKQDFIDTLSMEISKTNKEETFVLYFSGHGGRFSGKHYLCFSDGCFSTQEIISFLDNSELKTRILFIDACNTGTGTLSDNVLSENDVASEAVGRGTIVLASCREKEYSSYLLEQPISIFTAILANAFSLKFLIKKGCIFMEDIAKYVSLAVKVGYGRDFENIQTPVYYTNVIGDIYFKVAEYVPYQVSQYYSEHEDYIIYSVDDTCTNSAKRYSVKIILKVPMLKEEVSEISLKILDELRHSDVYKSAKNESIWRGKHVNHLFMYFGRDEVDMDGNFEYRSIWVDDKQDKAHWYKSAEIINDVGVIYNSFYDMLRRFTIENTGTKEDVINTTRRLLYRLINDGGKVISLYRSYTNDEINETDFIKKATPFFKDINDCYIKISDVDIAPIELSKWSGLCDCIAGKVSDMTLFFNERGLATRTQSNRRDCMEMTIRQYQQDLLALKEEERQLGMISE